MDIVERLRRTADASRREDGTFIPLGQELAEAADEIERLREALAWIAKHTTDDSVHYGVASAALKGKS